MKRAMSFAPASAMIIAAMGILLASAGGAAAQKKPIDHLYGPQPEWEQYREIAERNIIGQLIDPESARITWFGRFAKGEFKPFLQSRVAGYIGCGTVNARNRMGGYTGMRTFVVVIDYDRILHAEIDTQSSGFATKYCTVVQQAGAFTPLPASTGSVPPMAPAEQASVTTAGLTLRAMPDGAYISAVTANSPAAGAGLKPGMVIDTINAIPLAGMGDAMLKVIEAAGPAATFGVVGGQTFKPGAKP